MRITYSCNNDASCEAIFYICNIDANVIYVSDAVLILSDVYDLFYQTYIHFSRFIPVFFSRPCEGSDWEYKVDGRRQGHRRKGSGRCKHLIVGC